MFCSNCGRELPEGTKFCPECGTPSGDGTTGAVSMGNARDIQHGPAAAAGRRRPAGLAVVAGVMALLAVVCVGVFVVGANPFGQPAPEEPVAQEEPAEQEQPSEQEPADSELEFTAQDDDRSKTDDEDAAEKDERPADSSDEQDDAPAAEKDERPADSADEQDDAEEPDDSDVDTTPTSGDYLLPDSDSHVYTAQELSGMSDWELYIARNEIYARHGRCFNNDDLQSYFDGKSWYSKQISPEAFDQRAGQLLNATELKNAETILSVEQARGSAYI